LRDGFLAGLGVVTFNTILAVAVGIAGLGFAQSLVLLSPSPSPITVTVRLAVAGALIAIGFLQLLNRGGHGRFAARIAGGFARLARGGHGRRGLFVYGFAYTAIGIGCTGPFLASVVLVGFAAGGPGTAALAFLLFAFTMAGIMIAISVLSARRPQRALALVKRAPKVKILAGGALVVFGALLAFLTAFPSVLRPLFP
jgi:cytochrome c biogenesis protein CcdA